MKFYHPKHILPFLLIAALLIGCFPAAAEDSNEETYIYPIRTAVPFSEMSADNFDSAALDAALEDIEEKTASPDSFNDIKADYGVVIDQFDRLNTDLELSYLQYCRNTTDQEAFELYSSKAETAAVYSDRICIVLRGVLESDYSDAFRTYVNSEKCINDFISYNPMTEKEFELSNELIGLTDRYYALCDSGGSADEAAELYLELLDNLIASAAFHEEYSSAAEYYYARSYMRDYSPEEAASMFGWVKENIVPLLDKVVFSIYGNHYGEYTRYCRLQVPGNEIIERVRPFLCSVSDTAALAFSAMTELGLYDISASQIKYPGGFTTNLYYYGVPFLFNSPDGYGMDIETVIHEFGHYLQFFNNDQPMAYQYDCIDIAEIDSQAMEMLMMANADDIFGEKLGRIARMNNLFQMLNSIVNGCIFDEFQQAALSARMDGTLVTAEDVNNLYIETERAYHGEFYAYYCWQNNWYQVHHTFNTPFYYISYATSATAALGFLTAAEEDYATALELYNQLIEMGCDKGFSYTLDTLGMPNPLTEDGRELLASGLTEYFAQFSY